jgi:dienelactone hydrolase
VRAHSGHLARRLGLLLLVLVIVSVVVAACGGNDASPAATSGTIATPTSDTLSRGEVARLFHYDRRRPLAITRLGLTARLPPARELDGVTVQSITYASPKGGEVPALVVVPKGKGPFPGVIVQHGLPDTKEGMLPAGIDLARTGALAILIDAPFNRPQQGRVRSDPLTFTPKDRDEQIQLIVDLRRAVDLLVARPDVNSRQLAYFGVSYGAAMGGLLARGRGPYQGLCAGGWRRRPGEPLHRPQRPPAAAVALGRGLGAVAGGDAPDRADQLHRPSRASSAAVPSRDQGRTCPPRGRPPLPAGSQSAQGGPLVRGGPLPQLHRRQGHDGVACSPHPHRPRPIQVPTLTAAPGLPSIICREVPDR